MLNAILISSENLTTTRNQFFSFWSVSCSTSYCDQRDINSSYSRPSLAQQNVQQRFNSFLPGSSIAQEINSSYSTHFAWFFGDFWFFWWEFNSYLPCRLVLNHLPFFHRPDTDQRLAKLSTHKINHFFICTQTIFQTTFAISLSPEPTSASI